MKVYCTDKICTLWLQFGENGLRAAERTVKLLQSDLSVSSVVINKAWLQKTAAICRKQGSSFRSQPDLVRLKDSSTSPLT